MKHAIAALVAMTMVLLSAEAKEKFVYNSVAELVRTCDDRMNNLGNAIEHGICIGYITGVGQTLNAMTKAGKMQQHMRVCLTEASTIADRARTLVGAYHTLATKPDGVEFLRRVEDNPLEYINAVFAVQYPCP